MQNQSSDINLQIDRILSCNIRQELLSDIPIELLQSPSISKTKHNRQPTSSSKPSEKKAQFEQDLYEKAEQILKLKELLESELANINQIVMENQKLTEANDSMKSELKKLKNDLKQFRISIIDKIQSQIHSLKHFQADQIQLLKQQMFNKKFMPQKVNNMSILPCDQIIEKSIQISFNQQVRHQNLQIAGCSVSISITPHDIINHHQLISAQTKSDFLTQKSVKNLQVQVAQLNQTIKLLQNQNELYLNKIKLLQEFKARQCRQASNNASALQQKQFNYQQQSIQRYSSIFMKSIFQNDQNIDETIRKALYSTQKSIFDQLKEGKYFGKIFSKTKNGNAIEDYRNGFRYEGKFHKDHRHGLGKLFYKHQIVYSGEWKLGKFQGKGIIYSYLNLNVQKIQGNFKNGLIHGFATLSFKSGYNLRAHFKNNILQSEFVIQQKQNPKSQLNPKINYQKH